jgi:ankyrin repeat protein
MKALMAPEIADAQITSQQQRRTAATMAYLAWWAQQNRDNFTLYQNLQDEYQRIEPQLASYYQDKFHIQKDKADKYAGNLFALLIDRAAGSFPSAEARTSVLSGLQMMLSLPDMTREQLQAQLAGTLEQNELDNALKTALLKKKPADIILLLLDKGARINVGDESALFFALHDPAIVQLLLSRGADINYENGFGKTVLFYAIGDGNHALVKLLLENRADVNHAYKNKAAVADLYCGLEHTKKMPLMHAAQHADPEMLKILFKYGARLDSRDETGANTADYAALNKNPDNLNYLKSLGLQPAVSH